jgi:hypothetical protein
MSAKYPVGALAVLNDLPEAAGVYNALYGESVAWDISYQDGDIVLTVFTQSEYNTTEKWVLTRKV